MEDHKVFDQKLSGQKISLNEKLGEPIQITTTESRSRLAQHMSVLQAYGYSDIATLGELKISSNGFPGKTLLQKNGVLFPNTARPSNKVIGETSSNFKNKIE